LDGKGNAAEGSCRGKMLQREDAEEECYRGDAEGKSMAARFSI